MKSHEEALEFLVSIQDTAKFLRLVPQPLPMDATSACHFTMEAEPDAVKDSPAAAAAAGGSAPSNKALELQLDNSQYPAYAAYKGM